MGGLYIVRPAIFQGFRGGIGSPSQESFGEVGDSMGVSIVEFQFVNYVLMVINGNSPMVINGTSNSIIIISYLLIQW